MKKLFTVFFLSFVFCTFFTRQIFASSDRAYQDYLFQSDVYRTKYNDFSIAKNEYLKFKTLASEATVITKVRDMLSQRSLLLRSYLLLLSEKINETQTMNGSDKQLYQSLITNEVAFLENHSKFVESVSSIKDAAKASDQLQQHYVVLSISIRQIILGLTQSRLMSLGDTYSGLLINSQILLNQAKTELPLDRQNTLDRWFQKISDKRTLFLQKIDSVNQAKSDLKGSNGDQIQSKFQQILPIFVSGKQDLKEGTSYLNELVNAMRFKD